MQNGDKYWHVVMGMDKLKFIEEGNKWFNQGKYEKAISWYDQALEIDPLYGLAWNNKGLSLQWLGQELEALLYFDKAIEIDPNHKEAWNNWGLTLYRLNRFDEVVIKCDKAIEIDPNYKQAWNIKGLALIKLDKLKEGLACINKVLEIDPLFTSGWNSKGNALHEMKRYEESIACYDKALEIDPNFKAAQDNKKKTEEKLAEVREKEKEQSIKEQLSTITNTMKYVRSVQVEKLAASIGLTEVEFYQWISKYGDALAEFLPFEIDDSKFIRLTEIPSDIDNEIDKLMHKFSELEDPSRKL